MDDNEKRNKAKLDFFYDEKMKVHVDRKDRQFWNGYIVGKKTDEIFLFQDDKLGLVHLFISDIWEVEEYRREGV